MQDFSGKAALVMGASAGIGLATARMLAECGASVGLMARRTNKVEAAAASFRKTGGKAVAIAGDVSDFAAVERAVSTVVDAFGTIDILVNNAGVIDPISRLEDSDPALWSKVVDVNVKGVYHGMRAVVPVMKRQRGGVIVNISSGAATSALEGWSHYCSTKAAAKMLTACGHHELADDGIRVVGLSPGTVATEMQEQIRQSGINPVSRLDWDAHIPPEWAAQAVVFLCGPKGAEFAGTDFSIKTAEGRKIVGLPMPA